MAAGALSRTLDISAFGQEWTLGLKKWARVFDLAEAGKSVIVAVLHNSGFQLRLHAS